MAEMQTGMAGECERVLFELAKRDKSDFAKSMRAITEATAVVLGVARASVWRIAADEGALICQDLYLAGERRHEQGMSLFQRDCPSYFAALLESRVISAGDARTDPRTREFTPNYLDPLGITSMLDVPIWREGELYGVLCCEHIGPRRSWRTDEETIAANLSDLVSLSLEAADRHAAEHRWQAVVESIAEAVFVLDSKGRPVQANPAARALLARANGADRLDAWMRTAEYRDRAGNELPLDQWPALRALRGETVRGEQLQLRSRLTGEELTVRVTCSPVREGDRIVGTVGVYTDVSEEVHLEELQRELLAALAHELKTPVAITKGYVQHLAALDFHPEMRPMLRAIDRASNRMERLVDDLVDVSSLRLGRLALHREPVELTAMVRGLVDRFARTAPTHHLRVDATQPVEVMIDRPRVEQALRRLLDNAVRYSPEGSIVDVAVRVSDDDVVCVVRDNGIGIPLERQKHVFQIFYRAHAGTRHDVGGLGVGLFLAREIAVRHGGALWFESAEGRGSTFFLRLPRATESSS
jgi:PAS domain S-box-containing protein